MPCKINGFRNFEFLILILFYGFMWIQKTADLDASKKLTPAEAASLANALSLDWFGSRLRRVYV